MYVCMYVCMCINLLNFSCFDISDSEKCPPQRRKPPEMLLVNVGSICIDLTGYQKAKF